METRKQRVLPLRTLPSLDLPSLAECFTARMVLAGIPSRIVARTYLHDNGARGYLLAAITSSGGAVISSRAQRRDETLDIST